MRPLRAKSSSREVLGAESRSRKKRRDLPHKEFDSDGHFVAFRRAITYPMSNSRSGLLAGGNWIVDAVKIIDTWPQQDALANILSTTKGTGGSPFNVLVDLAIMGTAFPLAAVGLVGDDENGRWIREQCAQHEIADTALLTTAEAPTSYTDVMTIQSNGRRTFFHARGANALLDREHFDFTTTTARIFHLGYLLLLDKMDAPSATHGTVAAEVLGQCLGSRPADFDRLRERRQRPFRANRHPGTEIRGPVYHE